MTKSLFFLSLILSISVLKAQTIYYVSHNGNDNAAGTSWATSFGTVQKALDTAIAGDEIRIESGTFYPTEIYDSTEMDAHFKAFHTDKNLTIEGGYLYGSTRQDFNNPTIFSGDFSGNDVVSGSFNTFQINGMEENAYHVMVLANISGSFNISNIHFKGGACHNSSNNSNYDGQSIIDYLGGGMYVINSHISLNHVQFSENKSLSTIGSNGSGIFLKESTLIMNECIFNQNLGTAFYSRQSNITIENSEFSNNSNPDQNAGAMFLSGTANGIISNCNFNNNYTEGYGGAVYSEINLAVNFTNFIHNTSVHEGGAFRGSSLENFNSHTSFNHCEFIENESNSYGGALYMFQTFAMENSLLSFNNADFSGGALYSNKSFGLSRVKFIQNTSQYNGGAMLHQGSESFGHLNNVVFDGNQSNTGAGIFASSGLLLQNILMYNNVCNNICAGIYLNSGIYTFTNSTFIGNHQVSQSNFGVDIYLNNDVELTVNNSIFHNSVRDVRVTNPATSTILGTNNASFTGAQSLLNNVNNYVDLSSYTTAQIFINPNQPTGNDQIWATDDDGLYPKSTSVIKDAGMDGINTLTTDLGGEARYTGIIDIGAYEYNGVLNLDDISDESSEFSVYPTICHSFEILKIISADNIPIQKVDIVDAIGSLIDSKSLNFNEFQLPNLKKGIYFIKLTSEVGKLFTVKIIVQ